MNKKAQILDRKNDSHILTVAMRIYKGSVSYSKVI